MSGWASLDDDDLAAARIRYQRRMKEGCTIAYFILRNIESVIEERQAEQEEFLQSIAQFKERNSA